MLTSRFLSSNWSSQRQQRKNTHTLSVSRLPLAARLTKGQFKAKCSRRRLNKPPESPRARGLLGKLCTNLRQIDHSNWVSICIGELSSSARSSAPSGGAQDGRVHRAAPWRQVVWEGARAWRSRRQGEKCNMKRELGHSELKTQTDGWRDGSRKRRRRQRALRNHEEEESPTEVHNRKHDIHSHL